MYQNHQEGLLKQIHGLTHRNPDLCLTHDFTFQTSPQAMPAASLRCIPTGYALNKGTEHSSEHLVNINSSLHCPFYR